MWGIKLQIKFKLNVAFRNATLTSWHIHKCQKNYNLVEYINMDT